MGTTTSSMCSEIGEDTDHIIPRNHPNLPGFVLSVIAMDKEEAR